MSKIHNFPDIADSQGYWEGPGLEEKEPVALCAHPWGSEIGLPGSKPETAVAPVHPRMIPEEEAGRRSNSPATGEQGLLGVGGGGHQPRPCSPVYLQCGGR